MENSKDHKAAAEPPLDCRVRWWRWPENKLTGVAPWFVIAWRLPWLPLVMVGLCVSCIGIAMMYGIPRAADFWHRAT